MRTTEIITSAQNPKFKNLLLLQEKSKARREQGLFVVEGVRELEHCMEAGYNVRTVFVCPEICPEQRSVSGTIATLGEREGPTEWEGLRSNGDGNTALRRRKEPSVTFHRAFDVCRRPMRALEDIIGLGCDRILTSGQAPSAQEGIPLLRRLVKKAGSRIIIMPGGGITLENRDFIAAETGATELHGTRLV